MNKEFSVDMTNLFTCSKYEALRMNSNLIKPEHLVLGLIGQENSKATNLLRRMQVDLESLKDMVEAYITKYADTAQKISNIEKNPSLDSDAYRIVRIGMLEAQQLRSETMDTTHLLLALLHDSNNVARMALQNYNVSYNDVLRELTIKSSTNASFGTYEDDDEAAMSNKDSANNIEAKTKIRSNNGGDTPLLDSFGVDLTKEASNSKLDMVVGRDREIERIAQILCRRKKNNPILIGEPGVGKTAIVEGLALRIIQKRVPRSLYNKRLVSIDMASVVAGTKYRGQFEERLKNIINELSNNPNVIVFIDELHTIVGAGSSAGTMDAANMLKPALSRGEIQCIGATTTDEYRKNIEKDGALERRFQKVQVEPTTQEETLRILEKIKEKYETYHRVSYLEEALQTCVELSERYIIERCFPDKAIDVLDEAGARAYLQNVQAPDSITAQESVIANLTEEKIEAAKRQDFEKAADLRDQIVEEERTLEELREQWLHKMDESRPIVGKAEIEAVVSMMSGIPVTKMSNSERIRLKGMRENLQNIVISQNEPIDKLVRAITRRYIGIKDPKRPIGTFMFLGPTGVGKTHLVKALAEFMFGSPDAMIRIDMSEYMEKYTVSRLVGAPPGYVGYEEGGQLTERVRRHPYSIILLDEIEKAHGDVFNLLLQVMDEGRLTDSNGATIDFKNTIIIMTSNTGSRQLKDFGRGVGFDMQSASGNDAYAQSIIRKAMQKQFSPEFLNRIDEIITFNSLSSEAIRHIADLEINTLSKRVSNIGYDINISDEARDFVAQKGCAPEYGARPLKRAIQVYLEDLLSEAIINGQIEKGKPAKIIVNSKEDKLAIDKNLVLTDKK